MAANARLRTISSQKEEIYSFLNRIKNGENINPYGFLEFKHLLQSYNQKFSPSEERDHSPFYNNNEDIQCFLDSANIKYIDSDEYYITRVNSAISGITLGGIFGSLLGYIMYHDLKYTKFIGKADLYKVMIIGLLIGSGSGSLIGLEIANDSIESEVLHDAVFECLEHMPGELGDEIPL